MLRTLLLCLLLTGSLNLNAQDYFLQQYEPYTEGIPSPEEFLDRSASVLVSRLGSGRVVLFADNPNFRGSWYGTNRLFLNALFLGEHINVPE